MLQERGAAGGGGGSVGGVHQRHHRRGGPGGGPDPGDNSAGGNHKRRRPGSRTAASSRLFRLFAFTAFVAFGATVALVTLDSDKALGWLSSPRHVYNPAPTGNSTPPPSLTAPTELVRHGFAWSRDRQFVAVDRYIVNIEGVRKVAVLGDGTIPLFLKADYAIARFTCSMGSHTDKPARVVMMRGHKPLQQHYNTQKKYPFSTNGDNFKSMIIYCSIPVDDGLAESAPPLILKSSKDDSFYLSISTPFVITGEEGAPLGLKTYGAKPPAGALRSDASEYRLVLCLCPMYNIKSSRWLVEYLEYHRAAGVTHVHLYSHDSPDGQPLKTVLSAYSRQGFVTTHDWSSDASQGFTNDATYEHAKWSAQTDCLLRSRGVADFVLFLDIDEVAFGDVHAAGGQGRLGNALRECHQRHLKTSKTVLGCSFNSHTVTSIFTKLTSEEQQAHEARGSLMLEKFDYEESEPLCPYNCRCRNEGAQTIANHCRKFHYGRQKYIVYTGDVELSPAVMWTHAIWRDYGLADKGMHILPDHVLHCRHYQGHWYINDQKINTVNERRAALPGGLLKLVEDRIKADSTVNQVYHDYPGSGYLDWITPVDRPLQYHHKKKSDPVPSPHFDMPGAIRKYVCSPEEAQAQEQRIKVRFKEWWSHSACPDQVWMETFPALISHLAPDKPLNILDIGCNKGYTSADFFDLVHPSGNFNAKTLHNAINQVAREKNTEYKRACGACGDCTRAPSKDRTTKMPVNVHCFEPSPATFEMLNNVKAKLDIEQKSSGKAIWHIHNKGLHNSSGILAWHSACQNAVGDELCTIVNEKTPGAIKVPVVTVDDFARSSIKEGELIHMLKIDAEGLDPAVLKGSVEVLRDHRAVYVMFEFNPGLRDKKPPYGMWGVDPGLTKLLEVTTWLDNLSYDCYLDSRVDGPKGINAPPLYRINGNCIRSDPRIFGWSNVICASRAYAEVAQSLLDLSVLVGKAGSWE